MDDADITPEMIWNAIQANHQQGQSWLDSLARRGVHAALMYADYAQQRLGQKSNYEAFGSSTGGDW